MAHETTGGATPGDAATRPHPRPANVTLMDADENRIDDVQHLNRPYDSRVAEVALSGESTSRMKCRVPLIYRFIAMDRISNTIW